MMNNYKSLYNRSNANDIVMQMVTYVLNVANGRNWSQLFANGRKWSQKSQMVPNVANDHKWSHMVTKAQSQMVAKGRKSLNKGVE